MFARRLNVERCYVHFCKFWRLFIQTFATGLVNSFLGNSHQSGPQITLTPLRIKWSPCDPIYGECSALKTPRCCRGLSPFLFSCKYMFIITIPVCSTMYKNIRLFRFSLILTASILHVRLHRGFVFVHLQVVGHEATRLDARLQHWFRIILLELLACELRNPNAFTITLEFG